MPISLQDKSWRWTVDGGSYFRFSAIGLLAVFLFITANPAAQADEVIRRVDDMGRVHFSNQTDSSKVDAEGGHPYGWVGPHGHKIYSDRSREKVKAEHRRIHHNMECLKGITEIISGPVTAGTGRVVLLTARWCAPSKKARAYLKKNRIKFVEYDIDRHRAGRILYESLPRRGVPVIIAGGQRMFGFRADLVKGVLQRSGHLPAAKK